MHWVESLTGSSDIQRSSLPSRVWAVGSRVGAGEVKSDEECESEVKDTQRSILLFWTNRDQFPDVGTHRDHWQSPTPLRSKGLYDIADRCTDIKRLVV